MATVITLLTSSGATATGAAVTVNVQTPVRFQATLAGTNTVTATVLIDGTNDPSVTTSWLLDQTITLSGTTTAQDGVRVASSWPYVRSRISAISATSAVVTMSL